MDAWRAGWKAIYGFEPSLLLKPLEQMQLEQQIEQAIGEARFLDARRRISPPTTRTCGRPSTRWRCSCATR
jgi:hypothetical protein